jgi:Flp pilus assembly protein TadG
MYIIFQVTGMSSRLLDIARDRAGSVMLEFTIVLPLLLFMLIGVLQIGIFYYDYISLTDATAAGARQFSISRLDATPATDTVAAIENASCNPSSGFCTLNSANLTITLSVNGTPCAAGVTGRPANASQYDSACQNALCGGNCAINLPTLQPISVTVLYSCRSLMPVSWLNLASICPLTMTMMQRAQ